MCLSGTTSTTQCCTDNCTTTRNSQQGPIASTNVSSRSTIVENTNVCSTSNNFNKNLTSTNINEIHQRKRQIISDDKDAVSTKTKDINLDDKNNFGYKEKENAVYKEKILPDNVETVDSGIISDENSNLKFTPKIRWPDLMAQLFLHFGALYGVYLTITVANFKTFLWVAVLFFTSGIGITAGAHRLWSHKSYTASTPLRIVLMFFFTIAGQRDAYTWALDHRIHHKFSETDADPHNSKRGFFFAHVGWLFLTPHPKVVEKRHVIDISDLENDKIVMFQRKWYIPLFTICSIIMPMFVPWYLWNENLWIAFWMCFNMRFTSTLNVAFFVNSLAHMWGRKPYDKKISPVESPIVSLMALGEGWHNYHHVFPWDYKTGEFGSYSLNITTAFIDFCAKIGLATGRKSVSSDMITRRAAKCGDGTRFLTDDYAHKDQVWGYGDQDIPHEDAVELEKMKD